jgi:hypothetical protein
MDSNFLEVGERDRVVARLQRSYRGLRPVLFWSPYEAAAWTIIGHRIRISQALASSSAWRWSWETKSKCTVLVCSPFPALKDSVNWTASQVCQNARSNGL